VISVDCQLGIERPGRGELGCLGKIPIDIFLNDHIKPSLKRGIRRRT